MLQRLLYLVPFMPTASLNSRPETENGFFSTSWPLPSFLVPLGPTFLFIDLQILSVNNVLQIFDLIFYLFKMCPSYVLICDSLIQFNI